MEKNCIICAFFSINGKDFTKMGWKLVLITLFVITGTFIFSALVADIVLKMTGAI